MTNPNNETRRREATAVAAEFGDGLFGRLARESASWTDEQWAEHDARVATQRADAERAVSAKRDQDRAKLYAEAGFPRRALDVVVSGSLDERAPTLLKLREWRMASGGDGIVVLSGPPGCGKTVAACWWAWQQNWPPQFVRATTFAATSRYSNDERRAWLNANALVLDDLGAEYSDAKGSFLVDLDELVDVYYSNRRQLVITTNCTSNDFQDRYGGRIYDRLRECGTWLSVSSGSLRRKAAP
ncbi:MAG: hypothetical protein ACTHU0_19295 [Kofleriaceae bacterium]